LEPNAVDDDQLHEIADGSAGVARRGIQALRAAAELATEREHPRVQSEDVADSFDRARTHIRTANLSSLPFHHHVLYNLVCEGGEVSGRELHDRYDESAADWYRGRASTPISKRARRNKLAKLIEYDLVEREDVSGGVVYRQLDDAVESELSQQSKSGFEATR
jgi:Cdc6-like AAA superfamily ATPase